jgi:hypothetical protein
MPEQLSRPSPMQFRAELEEMIRHDLLGPAGGPYEEVAERSVRGRYIVGLLAPAGRACCPTRRTICPWTALLGRPPLTLTTRHRATFEILTDDRGHGIPVVA